MVSQGLTPVHEEYLRGAAISILDNIVSTDEGIEFHLEGVSGRTLVQTRPDVPREDGGKYVTPAGSELVMPVPPGMRALVEDPTVPLLIVEGTKGHLAAASALRGDGHPDHIAVVGVLGCWGWSSEGRPIQDLVDLPLDGRDVVVLFDADFKSNRSVWDAAKALGDICKAMGNARRVRFASLPGAGKQSIDDYLSLLPVSRRSGMVRRIFSASVESLGRAPSKKPRGPFPDGYSAEAAADLLLNSGQFPPMAVASDSSIVVYKDGQFHNGRSQMFEDMTQRLLGPEYTTARLKDVESVVLARLTLSGRKIPELQERLLVPFRNGLLDPFTGELHPHDPDFLTLRRFQVDWDPEATCPVYDEWLPRQCNGEAVLADLEETISQVFDMTRTPVKGLLLFGPSRSGKGTFARLVESVVGKENTAAVSLHKLASNTFASADLLGKTLNVYADLSPAEVSDISTLKLALGEDLIRAERKHGQPFMFRNTAVMMFSANEIPPVSESSQAYFARIKPFEFPNTYLGSEDTSILEALLSELPGVVVRWVRAMVRRIGRGSFLPTDPATDQKFRMRSDRVAEFVWSHYHRDEESKTPSPELFARYKVWSEDNRQGVLGRTRFLDRVRNLGVTEYKDERSRGFRLAEGPAGRVGTVDPTFPIETTSLSSENDIPIGQSKQTLPTLPGPGDSFVVPVDLETGSAKDLHTAGPGFVRLVGTPGGIDQDAGRVVSLVEGYRPIVAHNGFNFDFVALARYHGLDYLRAGDEGLLWDSKVAAILADPPVAQLKGPDRYYSLDNVAKRLGVPGKTDDLKALAKTHGGYERIPLEVLTPYLEGDVAALDGISATFPLLTDPYYEREMRVMARLGYGLRVKGWAVDEELVASRVAGIEAELARGREILARYGWPGGGSRPQATKAGREAFERFLVEHGYEIEARFRTATGAIATGRDAWGYVLENDPDMEPEVRLVIETVVAMGGARTVFHTVRNNTVGGRVYPEFMPYQASGRFSIQNPGITVLGKRGGKYVEREVFLPDAGDVLVSFDLNQVDARAVAMHSQDPAYMALFQDPSIDSHREISRMVWGTPDRRTEAKALGHGWNYGMGMKSLASQAGIPLETAYEFDARMREQFPRLVEWQSEVRSLAESGEFLDNGMGRRMRPEPGRAHTQAPALLGQGLARDLLMEGVLRLPLDAVARLKGVVHDELVFSVPEDSVEDFSRVVLEAVQFEMRGVPVTAGLVGVGRNWGDVYIND